VLTGKNDAGGGRGKIQILIIHRKSEEEEVGKGSFCQSAVVERRQGVLAPEGLVGGSGCEQAVCSVHSCAREMSK
jgi:hypothetical protein